MPRGALIALIIFCACDNESPLKPAQETAEEIYLDGQSPPDHIPALGNLPGEDAACPDGVKNPRLDVLVILDDSTSMEDSQSEMKQQAARFVGRLTQLGLDYHLALTTTSLDGARRTPGALVAVGDTKVIARKDSLVAAQDFWKLLDAVDTKGAAQEFGVLTAALALSPSNERYALTDEFGRSEMRSGQRDPDFFRNDARTLVVIISDEDDSSTVPTDSQALISQRPGSADLRVVAVVDPSDGPKQGCKRSSAWTGTPIYHDAMNALGGRGQVVDFCAELQESVDFVALLALQQACAD